MRLTARHWTGSIQSLSSNNAVFVPVWLLAMVVACRTARFHQLADVVVPPVAAAVLGTASNRPWSAATTQYQSPRINVTINRFSRPVLNFQVQLRQDEPATEVFVTHLKSKLPTRVDEEDWFEADRTRTGPTRPRWVRRSRRFRRTAEAVALRVMLTKVMKETTTPVIVLGDINDGHLNFDNHKGVGTGDHGVVMVSFKHEPA